MATTIEPIAAIGDADPKYQFFKNKDTGNIWKATIDVKRGGQAFLSRADVEAAPTTLAISVTVSPVDAEGKALRENDLPIIIDSLTHTFTPVEMAEPDFDPMNRVMKIVAERVDLGEIRLAGASKILDIEGIWNKKAKLTAKAVTHSPEPISTVNPVVEEIVGVAGDTLKPGDKLVYLGTGEQIPNGSTAHGPTETFVEASQGDDSAPVG